jgi:hypothetical protein
MKPTPFNLLISLSILVTSCNLSSKNEVEFNPEKLISYHLVSEKLDNSNILNPRRLFSQAGFLFVIEDYRMPSNLPLIHIFRKEPLTYFNSKGKIGLGPLEAQSLEVHNPRLSDSTFVMYSGMDRKYIEYNIYDSTRLGIREFKLPHSETPLGSIFFSPDSIFIGIPTFDENKFVLVDLHGEKIEGFGKWESVEGKKEMSYFHHFHLNQGWFKSDEDFKLFVNASIFRDRLEIFNLSTKKIKTIDGPSGKLPDFKFYEYNLPLNIPISNPYRYRDVYISENRIYALYGGVNEAHYKKTGELAKMIFVFTRKGDPILKFDLDRSVSSIVVDEELKTIFGLTTDENPGIAEFRIPSGIF